LPTTVFAAQGPFTLSVSARLRPCYRACLVWSHPSRARYGHLLAAGVGYLGLGRLTARFSETSTKPFASNIKANLTLVTFTKYSFIWRVIIAEHAAKLHKLATIRIVDIGVGVLIDDDEIDVLGNFVTLTRAHHLTAFSCHCCSAFTNYAKLRIYGNKHVDRQSRQWPASFCPVLPIGADGQGWWSSLCSASKNAVKLRLTRSAVIGGDRYSHGYSV